jgi:pimeloyl-ACP methyl ester carboxylesterase
LSANYVHREVWKVLPNLLRVLLIEQPVPLGHSDGATIALLHASRQLSRCHILHRHGDPCDG